MTTNKLEAKVSKKLFLEVNERVRLGLFSNISEVINRALRKAFSEESREYLRQYVKSSKLDEKKLLQEWSKIRK